MSLLLVVGYGSGISHATAERFGRAGYAVALLGRNDERLADGVHRLTQSGVDARAFRADATDLASLRSAIAQAQRDMGAISTVLWTAYRNGDVKDVLQTDPEDVEHVFDIGVRGLLATVQQVLDDLKQSERGSILVANGALGEATSQADAYAKYLNNDGVALENSAKTKLVGLLAERLREFGIYVGEVTIAGSVSGTATASATAIDPSSIADTLWSMAEQRTTTRMRLEE